ncbi:uncharacterized protein LY79DRAFT_484077, partial [Colletotrichum navitas]
MQIAMILIASVSVRKGKACKLTFTASDDMWNNIGQRFQQQAHHEIACGLSARIHLIKTR